MKLPMSWLKEYTEIKAAVREFADKMTVSGSKVELIDYPGGKLDKIVVGKVVEIKKHENAEKLLVTMIDIGEGDKLQIVTGAANLFVGAYVPVALDGSVLADGKKIQKGVLRGVESNGMLCSINELGYTVSDYPEACEDGIYIFSGEPKLGADVREVLQLCDEVVEFEITSNRPDCFSIIGLAREAAAVFNKKLNYPACRPAEKGEGRIDEMIAVEIKNAELCPRYVARVVKNVKIAHSPLWLRHRLTAAGIRPINNIVDITNYVMLELGQPMHAFDIDCISGAKIIIRNAEKGEKFTTLDKEERCLDETMLVIADKEKAVAVAGVMGGENSKISGGANAVLFESANFNGTSVRLTSKKLGLRTDSSSKFEKGLDPELAMLAVNRAAELVELLGCGEVVKGCVDCYPYKKAQVKVAYTAAGINRLLGLNLSEQEITEYLERLEIKTVNGVAVIPSFRPDLQIEVDIAEEVARMYGYDRIMPTLPVSKPLVGKKTDMQLFEDSLRRVLTSNGLMEILTYAFESPKVFDKLCLAADSELRKAVVISNPMGEDYSIMRTTTLNSILSPLKLNYARRNDAAWLFELAKSYRPSEDREALPHEEYTLTIGLYGGCDFYDAKGICEALFGAFGIKAEYEACFDYPYMHPGRTARIFTGEQTLGHVGELHPQVLDNYEIGTRAYVAVLPIEKLFENSEKTPSYTPLPKFPQIKRDIALLLDNTITSGKVKAVIEAAASELLESCECFDVYKSEELGTQKSMAFSLIFRAADRTLKDDEVAEEMQKIVSAIEKNLSAKIRDK